MLSKIEQKVKHVKIKLMFLIKAVKINALIYVAAK